MARRLFVDIDNARLVSGLESGTTPLLDNLFQADAADYELYFLRESEAGSRAYELVNFASASVKLHIGAPPPSVATAYVASESWSNLSSSVTATVTRTITGTSSTNEQQTVAFSPEAVDGTFALTFPSQSLTFSALSAGVFTTSGTHGLATLQPWVPSGFTTPSGFANGQTLYVASVVGPSSFLAASTPTSSAVTGFSAATAGAGYTITGSTVSLPAKSTPAEVENALQAVFGIGSGNASVSGVPGKIYRVSFGGQKGQQPLPLMTVAQALVGPVGKAGTINFNTVELTNAISASASIEAVMEIEITDGPQVQTVLQTPVTLRNDLIASGSPTPVSAVTAVANLLLLDGSNDTWAISIDSDGVLTATKQ